MKKWIRRIVVGLVIAVVGLEALFYFMVAFPLWGMPFNKQRHGAPPLVPAWALEPWIWQADKIDEAGVLEHLNGYLDNDFPVGTVLIDCPWATRYNDFTVDEAKFPDPAAFFGGIEKRGIHVALWMSTMVNSKSTEGAIRDSADWFNEAATKGYLAGNGFQTNWWLGRGGFIDYTNPAAMAWWHGMQEQVLQWGVDAWKLDDTASFFSSRLGPLPLLYQKTSAGWMTTRTYMDHFYRDELANGQAHHPEFVTLSRPIDSVVPFAHPEGFAPMDAAMVNWVGDNQHTWDDKDRGIERAIRCILRSAKLGYNLVGSDIAGYHGSMDIAPELYIRWAQFSAFCGFFLDGGRGERRLWLRTPQELELIRKYSWLHSELVPYIYCSVSEAHEGGKVLMRPMDQGDSQYGFGDWLLVAPIHRPSNTRDVVLPPGRWRYWFDDTTVLEGGQTISREFPLEEYPVFIRDGAVIPMNIRRDYTGIGARDWDGALTLNVYPFGETDVDVPDTKGTGTLHVSVEATVPLRIALSGDGRKHILRVYVPTKPTEVDHDGIRLPEGSVWRYDEATKRLVVKGGEALTGVYTIL